MNIKNINQHTNFFYKVKQLCKKLVFILKKILKKVPIVFHLLKIIQDKRYFYHFLQGLLTNKHSRFFFKNLESKLFYRKIDKCIDHYTDVNNDLDSLKKNGFIENPLIISSTQVNEIVNFLKLKPMHDPEQGLAGYFFYNDKPKNIKRGFYKCEDVVCAPNILNIANDQKLLSIAYNYFGAIPKIDYVGSWWSFPSNTPALTQSFHRDVDTLNSLKFFVYLSDVDYESGPHVYIKGSHNSSYETSKGKQHDDNELKKKFKNTDIISFEGKSGYSFIADTFGFHKGLIPSRKNRLILQIIYTLKSTPFGPKKPFVTKEDLKKLDFYKYSNYINRNIIKH
tara:strand:- start:119 stop:1132 length:1014 start_codon:yes stop_codon:yes gene_type:complete